MSGDADPKPGATGDADPKPGVGDGKLQLTQAELDAKMAEVRRGVEKSTSEKFADYDDLKSKAAQYEKLEESKKSEEQKLLDRIEALEKSDAEKAEALKEAQIDKLRERVRADRGLSDAQVARLKGATLEELEADATEVFGEPKEEEEEPPKKGLSRQPRPDLKGGSDPTSDAEPDIQKVFDNIEL